MHEVEILSTAHLPQSDSTVPAVTRLRVPGGWIYTTYDYQETPGRTLLSEVTPYKSAVFVPTSAEALLITEVEFVRDKVAEYERREKAAALETT